MGVPERRDSTRRQASEIDAEVLEAKQVPEYALLSARDSRREWLWVDGFAGRGGTSAATAAVGKTCPDTTPSMVDL